jgi:SM-20-related protein
MLDIRNDLPLTELRRQFADTGRVQIHDVLMANCAQRLSQLLLQRTEWGLAWQAGENGPNYQRSSDLRAGGAITPQSVQQSSYAAMQTGQYAFQFGSYPMLRGYLERWSPDCELDRLLEHINDQPFLDLIRHVTAIPELKKADAQATLYAPGHFLAEHDDSHVGQGWRVAYVLNLCAVEWKADWGGYLNFLDDAGNVVAGWKPRFNSLNLFKVPQRHHVTMVAPFAPVARIAITGWFRDQ